MSTALVNLDIVLIGLGVWIALAFLTAPIIGRMIRGPKTPRFENPGKRERLGLLTEDRMEREERARRAIQRAEDRRAEEFRQTTREMRDEWDERRAA